MQIKWHQSTVERTGKIYQHASAKDVPWYNYRG